ncbi:MAG TPA: FHA domain-containing protein, partial [Pyrinomonadaceae bacterium]|nr:FHA domain-containing protein [Pyrinomonadaceae bacterium]
MPSPLVKIVLRLHPSEPEPRSFDEPGIKFGRDPDACQVAFESARRPMVSRHRVELRKRDGGFMLVDCGSSFGAYLNGELITEPVA